MDTRAAPAGSQALGATKDASPTLEGAEAEASEEQSPAESNPVSRDLLALEEKVLGYIMSYPGVRPEDVEIIFGLSKSEVDAALRSLTESGKLRKKSGLCYPTPSASLGPRSPKVSHRVSSEAKEFVSRLLKTVGHL